VFIAAVVAGAIVVAVEAEPGLLVATVLGGHPLLLVSVLGGLRPFVSAGPAGVHVRNPVRRYDLSWAESTEVRPGHHGLEITTREDEVVVAWAVQRSSVASRSKRRTRADDVADLLQRSAEHARTATPRHESRQRVAAPDVLPRSVLRGRSTARGGTVSLRDRRRDHGALGLGVVVPWPTTHGPPARVSAPRTWHGRERTPPDGREGSGSARSPWTTAGRRGRGRLERACEASGVRRGRLRAPAARSPRAAGRAGTTLRLPGRRRRGGCRRWAWRPDRGRRWSRCARPVSPRASREPSRRDGGGAFERDAGTALGRTRRTFCQGVPGPAGLPSPSPPPVGFASAPGRAR
jgi:hypothetical protein